MLRLMVNWYHLLTGWQSFLVTHPYAAAGIHLGPKLAALATQLARTEACRLLLRSRRALTCTADSSTASSLTTASSARAVNISSEVRVPSCVHRRGRHPRHWSSGILYKARQPRQGSAGLASKLLGLMACH
jgi:hypothetical protein